MNGERGERSWAATGAGRGGPPSAEGAAPEPCDVLWENLELADLHHFPLWEKGVHDTLQMNFPVLMRIFSHYTKGISGIDSAADALEMELEEFHDFVKDAKLETPLVTFTAMSNVFAKAAKSSASD